MLVIDNYDSFVYNLVQYLGELGAEPVVHRHDALDLDDLIKRASVVPMDDGVSTELPQVLDQVVDERVVVVDDEHTWTHRTFGRVLG